MIHIRPITQKDAGEYKPIIDTIAKKIMAAIQQPVLSIDPTKSPDIIVTQRILDAMGTDDCPAEPLTVIPGLIIQAYLSHISVIITLLSAPNKSMQIQAFRVEPEKLTIIE